MVHRTILNLNEIWNRRYTALGWWNRSVKGRRDRMSSGSISLPFPYNNEPSGIVVGTAITLPQTVCRITPHLSLYNYRRLLSIVEALKNGKILHKIFIDSSNKSVKIMQIQRSASRNSDKVNISDYNLQRPWIALKHPVYFIRPRMKTTIGKSKRKMDTSRLFLKRPFSF